MPLALDPLPILYLLVLDPLAQSPVRPTKATLHLCANGLVQPNSILPHFPQLYHHCKISYAELEVVPGWDCQPPSWRPSDWDCDLDDQRHREYPLHPGHQWGLQHMAVIWWECLWAWKFAFRHILTPFWLTIVSIGHLSFVFWTHPPLFSAHLTRNITSSTHSRRTIIEFVFAFDNFDFKTFANLQKLVLHSQNLFVKLISYSDQFIRPSYTF